MVNKRSAMYLTLIRAECGYALEAMCFVTLAGLIAGQAWLRECWNTDLLRAGTLCMVLVNVVVYVALKLIYGAGI